MERQGFRSHAGDDRRRVRERNSERERLHEKALRVDLPREAEARYQAERARQEAERHGLWDGRAEVAQLAIGPREVPDWQLFRERALSEAYATEMAGTDLARFWCLTRTRDALVFENARGHFEDRGSLIVARTGNEAEIRGMLDLAAIKGWQSLRVTGTDDFRLHVMQAAADRGFTVEAKGRDADLWSTVTLNRSLRPRRDDRTRGPNESARPSPERDDYDRDR